MTAKRFATLLGQYEAAYHRYISSPIGSDRYKKAEARMEAIYAEALLAGVADEFTKCLGWQ